MKDSTKLSFPKKIGIWYKKAQDQFFSSEKVNNPDYAHILSGILKCPCCGKSMYGKYRQGAQQGQKNTVLLLLQKYATPTGHEKRPNIEDGNQ